MRLRKRRVEPADHRDGSAADHAQVACLAGRVERAESALDGLPVGIVLLDTNAAVVSRNALATCMGGAAHGHVLLDAAITENGRRAVAGAESRAKVELFGRPKRVIDIHARPIDGGAVVTLDDVSEQARLDAVRTDFVANISHELRTPIGAIAVLAEALVDESDAEIMRRLAGKVMNEAHRAASAIDDLLELSRIELGGAMLVQPVDVTTIFLDVVERTKAGCDQRGSRLVTVTPEATTTLMGDRRQLVCALANLVDNAIKYSAPGAVVELEARPCDSSTEFIVSDRGIGIPPRDLERIFERFYRVDRARSRETGGTGLGLAIVRHVVTNHQGEISVESVEGEGSTFTMRIPAT